MRKTVSVISLVTIFLFLMGPVTVPAKESKKSKAEKAAMEVEQKAKKAEKAMTDAVSDAMPKVNINTADVDELATIKGIGMKTAESIVQYRKEIGKFERLDDLLNIKGIGLKTLEKIGPFIKFK